jgi:hypothetical protein
MMGAGRLRRTAATIMGGNAKNEKYTPGYGAAYSLFGDHEISFKVTELSNHGLRNFLGSPCTPPAYREC